MQHFKLYNLTALLGAICLLGFLSCTTVAETPNAPLPKLDGLDARTANKLKTPLETPNGIKQIYDPTQDITVRIVFKGLMQARQEADYFKGWPRHLLHRSDTFAPTDAGQVRWEQKIEANP